MFLCFIIEKRLKETGHDMVYGVDLWLGRVKIMKGTVEYFQRDGEGHIFKALVCCVLEDMMFY